MFPGVGDVFALAAQKVSPTPMGHSCGSTPCDDYLRPRPSAGGIQNSGKGALLHSGRCLLHWFVPWDALRMPLCGAEASLSAPPAPLDGGLLTNSPGLLTQPEPRFSGYHG